MSDVDRSHLWGNAGAGSWALSLVCIQPKYPQVPEAEGNEPHHSPSNSFHRLMGANSVRGWGGAGQWGHTSPIEGHRRLGGSHSAGRCRLQPGGGHPGSSRKRRGASNCLSGAGGPHTALNTKGSVGHSPSLPTQKTLDRQSLRVRLVLRICGTRPAVANEMAPGSR